MKRKILSMICILVLMAAVIGCGSEEAQETTTLTGMVTAIDGSVISLVEMSGSNGMDFQGGQRPSRPEGMEGMEGFEGFDGSFPEGFDGSFPEGFEGFDGSFPEGMEGFSPWGEGEMPSLPEGETMPQRPEGGARPEMPTGENGEMMELPTGEDGSFGGFGGFGGMGGFGSFDSQAEATQIDIGNAHISLEIEGGKASGTLEDITPGSFVTITRNAEGEVTNVLVSSRSSGRGGKSFS